MLRSNCTLLAIAVGLFAVGIAGVTCAPQRSVTASDATIAAAEDAVVAWVALNAGPREFTPPMAGMGLGLANRVAEAARVGVTERDAEALREAAFDLDARAQALDGQFATATRLTAEAAQALCEEVDNRG